MFGSRGWSALMQPSSPSRPSFGDIWIVHLDPIQGHEQGGTRPTVIRSAMPLVPLLVLDYL